MSISIPLGKVMVELMTLRKESKDWDPEEQMPWSKTTYIRDDKGKRFKVEVKLEPKEEINYAERDQGSGNPEESN